MGLPSLVPAPRPRQEEERESGNWIAERRPEDDVVQALHDARNAAAAVLADLEWLSQQLGVEPLEDCRRVVDEARDSCARLLRITRDSVTTARARHAFLRGRPRPTVIAELVGDLVRGHVRQAASVGVTLSGRVPPGLAANVDPDLLLRALENLVDNALRASTPGVRVIVQARRDARALVVSVTDDGPGIARTARTGLGLSFCRLVAEAHEGELQVERVEPSGTVIRIVLPPDGANEVLWPRA
ncbi:MAG: hypothetical protein IT376_15250 [Polyangiaceae bacterium]|nr:hypothetical protein [Polyangiaceae bacterium]